MKSLYDGVVITIDKDGRSLRTTTGTMLKNKPRLVILYEGILVILRKFQHIPVGGFE